MPAVKGYRGKHKSNRINAPGTVRSGRLVMDALGSQKPLGTISLARKKSKKGY